MGGAISSLGGGLGVAGGLLGGAVGGVPGMILGNSVGAGMNSAQPASVSGVNPQIGQIQQAQLKNANDYNANIGNTIKDQTNAATDANRLKTQQDVNSSRTNSNARGLLYGSYAQNQGNAAAASNASDLNKRIAGINADTQATGQALNQQAVSGGLISQGYNQEYNNAIYNAALQNQQQKAGAINGIIGGVGSAFGGLL